MKRIGFLVGPVGEIGVEPGFEFVNFSLESIGIGGVEFVKDGEFVVESNFSVGGLVLGLEIFCVILVFEVV